MAMPGETVQATTVTCEDCGPLKLQVCESSAGFYLGFWCDCGPYSRETRYWKTEKEAQAVLDSGLIPWR